MELLTQRLILSPTIQADFVSLFGIFTDKHVRKYLFDAEALSQEQVREFLEVSTKSFHNDTYGIWMMRQKGSALPIGIAGLWKFFGESQPQLLYALLPAYTGKGLASEASREILYYGFYNLGFKFLIASSDVENVASHKVAERIGMTFFKKEVINHKPLVFYRADKILLASTKRVDGKRPPKTARQLGMDG